MSKVYCTILLADCSGRLKVVLMRFYIIICFTFSANLHSCCSPALCPNCDLTDAQPPVLCQQVSIHNVHISCCDLFQDTLDDHGTQQASVQVITTRAAIADVDVCEALVSHQGYSSLQAYTNSIAVVLHDNGGRTIVLHV